MYRGGKREEAGWAVFLCDGEAHYRRGCWQCAGGEAEDVSFQRTLRVVIGL
ncbi:hypothetical protein KCP76_20740 [Salmonella enterica subsp. enterica serovar Weltevreden]|nr:hypothetical protein KCP76_20740 [Salmonella enterica subsp. enterica serovar Weltevreden]